MKTTYKAEASLRDYIYTFSILVRSDPKSTPRATTHKAFHQNSCFLQGRASGAGGEKQAVLVAGGMYRQQHQQAGHGGAVWPVYVRLVWNLTWVPTEDKCKPHGCVDVGPCYNNTQHHAWYSGTWRKDSRQQGPQGGLACILHMRVLNQPIKLARS